MEPCNDCPLLKLSGELGARIGEAGDGNSDVGAPHQAANCAMPCLSISKNLQDGFLSIRILNRLTRAVGIDDKMMGRLVKSLMHFTKE